MSSSPDPYEVLGVRPGDDLDTIRKAYRKAAKAWHPDLHPDDPTAEDRFKEAASAWQVLSDPEARARLDAKRGSRGPAGGYVDDGYHAALSDALQRAQDWLDRGVLPRVAARWRGAGAEALAAAVRDIDATVTPGPLPEVGMLAARRARALGHEVNIALDPHGVRPVRFLRHRKGWSLVFGLRGFQQQVPERELDDVVMRLLVDTALRCLLVERFPLSPDHPEVVAEARRHDDEVLRRVWGNRALWGAVFAVIAGMMVWAKLAQPMVR